MLISQEREREMFFRLCLQNSVSLLKKKLKRAHNPCSKWPVNPSNKFNWTVQIHKALLEQPRERFFQHAFPAGSLFLSFSPSPTARAPDSKPTLTPLAHPRLSSSESLRSTSVTGFILLRTLDQAPPSSLLTAHTALSNFLYSELY